jgi:hypothetical protein
METKFRFTKMNVAEFENWIANLRIGRTIIKIQQHHTYIPSYIHFTGSNHFERQLAMKNYHINQNGWQDIGQHFTIFPDGAILTGRSLEQSPACITNQNANSICIENFGNFDTNGDTMTSLQKDAIIAVTAALCKKFNLPVTSNAIVYHHWFRLDNGVRNNGSGNNKSCPGTNFFGGNKVADFEQYFAPLVAAKLNRHPIKTATNTILKYVCVAADVLNIRTLPKSGSPKAKERFGVAMGAVLRVYEEKENWYKISNSLDHWVAGKYTIEVKRATVNATVLNVRTGPGTSFPKTTSISKEEEVFVFEELNGWCKIGLEDKWVGKAFLNFKSDIK